MGTTELSGPPRGPLENTLISKIKSESAAFIWGGARARDTFTLEAARAFKHCSSGVRHALEIISKYDPKRGGTENLYLHGATGSGKSHLAVAASRIHHNGPEVAFWKVQSISRRIRSAETARHEFEALQGLIKSPVLIIDDLGAEKLTEFLNSILYEIIDGRWMQSSGGLVITSNMSLDDLVVHLGDDRISSRLAGMCKVIDLGSGPDIIDNRIGDRKVRGGAP